MLVMGGKGVGCFSPLELAPSLVHYLKVVKVGFRVKVKVYERLLSVSLVFAGQ